MRREAANEDSKARRLPPRMQGPSGTEGAQSEHIASEIDNIVTGIAGYAQLLAQEHAPHLVRNICTQLGRYRERAAALHLILRSQAKG